MKRSFELCFLQFAIRYSDAAHLQWNCDTEASKQLHLLTQLFHLTQ